MQIGLDGINDLIDLAFNVLQREDGGEVLHSPFNFFWRCTGVRGYLELGWKNRDHCDA